jgi:myosin heavy subunit
MRFCHNYHRGDFVVHRWCTGNEVFSFSATMLAKTKNNGRSYEQDGTQDYSWSGEYSMLIHNIEDNLDSQLPHPPSSQRKRIRCDGNENEENESFGVTENIDMNTSMNLVTVSNTVRLNIQISELKLSLTELSEKLVSCQQEGQREKEKLMRQLQFLEKDNLELKNSLTTREEKYYLMKKKLQTALRTIDTFEKQSSSTSSASSQRNNTSQNISMSSITSSSSSAPPNDGYVHELEAKILSKNEEVRYLSLRSSEYEERCGHLEQQLLTLRADLTSTETTSRSISSLQKQQTENEMKLRKQIKEIEKLESQLKNQQILEQELSSANQKIMQLKQSVKGFQEIEARYSYLLKEKESWTIYFKDVIKQLHSSSSPQGGPTSLLTGLASSLPSS